MSHLVWRADLETGIDTIDSQHIRIVEYINQLYDARVEKDSIAVGEIIENLIDYTVSHFSFEEALIEDAGYEFVKPHKQVHELFIRRITEFQTRFKSGEDVSEELHTMLARWLFNHIKNDDAAYVKAVKANILTIAEEKKKSNWLARFFRQ